jgi:hypothetical protein
VLVAGAALLVVHAGSKAVAAAALLLFAFLAPAWAVLVTALLLAGDWGSIVHRSPASSTLLAVLVAACVLLRSGAASGMRTSAGGALAAAAFLGFGLLVAVVDGNDAAGKGLWRAALPYLPLLLVSLRLDGPARTRFFDALAVVAVAYSVLFLLEETTSIHLLPGVATVQTGDFGGTSISRVQTYGQLIPVAGFVWSLSSLLTRTGRTGRSLAIAVVTLTTIVAGLGRTALLALVIAGAATALLAAARRPAARTTAVKILGLCIAAASVAFLYASQRFGAAYSEVASGSGNFGVRLSEWHERAPIVASHLLFGVGFDAQPGLGTSDSSFVSALVRFGLVGVAVGLIAAVVAFCRAARLAGDRSPVRARAGLFACGTLVYLVLAAPTTSSLYYPLGICLFALVLGLAWTDGAEEHEPAALEARVLPALGT